MIFRDLLICATLLLAAAPAFPDQGAPRKIVVSDGAITIAGPTGYCVDPASIRDGEDGAFALLGSCAALNGKGHSPRTRALMTATVLLGAPPGEDLTNEFRRMSEFFVTEAGRKALARDGKADSIRIERIIAAGDVLYILAEDRAPLAGYPVEPEYWRAIFARKGRMISLTVLGLLDAPIDQKAKRSLLDRFVSRVSSAN